MRLKLVSGETDKVLLQHTNICGCAGSAQLFPLFAAPALAKLGLAKGESPFDQEVVLSGSALSSPLAGGKSRLSACSLAAL